MRFGHLVTGLWLCYIMVAGVSWLLAVRASETEVGVVDGEKDSMSTMVSFYCVSVEGDAYVVSAIAV